MSSRIDMDGHTKAFDYPVMGYTLENPAQLCSCYTLENPASCALSPLLLARILGPSRTHPSLAQLCGCRGNTAYLHQRYPPGHGTGGGFPGKAVLGHPLMYMCRGKDEGLLANPVPTFLSPRPAPRPGFL